jgi:hypothetical protein
MRRNHLVSAYFSSPVLAASLLAASLLMARSLQAQAGQPSEPPRQPNFGFAAELDEQIPPAACDKDGPNHRSCTIPTDGITYPLRLSERYDIMA